MHISPPIFFLLSHARLALCVLRAGKLRTSSGITCEKGSSGRVWNCMQYVVASVNSVIQSAKELDKEKAFNRPLPDAAAVFSSTCEVGVLWQIQNMLIAILALQIKPRAHSSLLLLPLVNLIPFESDLTAPSSNTNSSDHCCIHLF
jgi:hypothetical protein